MTRVAVVLLSMMTLACSHQMSQEQSTPSTTPASANATDAAAPTLPENITMAMVTAGRTTFNGGSCYHCHGTDGRKGPYGPDLTKGEFVHSDGSIEGITNVIIRGVPASEQKLETSQKNFAMRPRGGLNYSDKQISNLAAYVWYISNGGK